MDVGDVIVIGGASLTVRDVGEPGFRVTGNLWAIGDGHIRLEGSVIEFLSTYHGQYALAGIDRALIEVVDCEYRIPSQVQHGLVIGGVAEMLIELHNSVVEPYPQDPTGEFTRFGAYDRARLLAHQTSVNTTPALGGDGVIGVTFIANPPEHPPSAATTLIGSAALFGLEGGPQLEHWRLEEVSRRGGSSTAIGEGDANVEEGVLGEWSDADPGVDVLLRTVLTDSWGRTLVGRHWVLGDGPRTRRAGSRRAP
jgi:hypothetical protein